MLDHHHSPVICVYRFALAEASDCRVVSWRCLQFFLCTAMTSWLDGKHCVFGQVRHPAARTANQEVVDGYNVVKAIESVGSRSGDTEFDVMIADCGQLEG
eukprot:scaffold665847_cov42-Prasinocladus_malaysianus.AAC.1